MDYQCATFLDITSHIPDEYVGLKFMMRYNLLYDYDVLSLFDITLLECSDKYSIILI